MLLLLLLLSPFYTLTRTSPRWSGVTCVVLCCVVLWSLSVLCSDGLVWFGEGLLQQTGPFVLGLPFVCLLQQRVVSCVHDAVACLAP